MGIKAKLKKYLNLDDINPFPNLRHSVIELNNYQELKKVFGWNKDPIMDRPDIYNYQYIEDVNERRIRDAECLATTMHNVNPLTALEIGTSDGMGTLLMSVNAPGSKIYTVNILPEDIQSGKGGVFTNVAPSKDEIGIAYREREINNITQIFANTADWEPDVGNIDLAFIDGCHDAEFVYNDSKKVIKHMKPGSFILWHDFNLELVKKHLWIYSVCQGVERLYKEGLINGRIFHVKDSWIGVFQIS